jgi:uncharacterized protein YbaR (Trm112 family)
MKRRFVDILVCPIDRGPLELVVWEIDGDEIITGILTNPRLRLAYPIYRGVPRMLTFEAGVAQTFEREHGQRLARELPGFSLPRRDPMPGEEDVLRSFSNEWVSYDWDGQSYWNLEPEAWFRCMRFVLDLQQRPVRGGRVLEIGIGIGALASELAKTEGCDLVGMDLGYAVDAAYGHFAKNPSLHIVQGSAFAPPFAPQSFDLVYSFGVLHHTFSTERAFRSVADLPKLGGRLNVWVYSPKDEERTLVRRTLMRLERAVRPIAWRLPERAQTAMLLPFVPMYMLYQGLQARGGAGKGNGSVSYGFREAMHAARDRFTPRYVHRHTEAEVCAWYEAVGYGDLECLSQRALPEWLPVAFSACTGVDGTRSQDEARPLGGELGR